MKRSWFAGVLAAAALLLGGAPAEAQKLGFIDTQRLLAEAPGVAEANKQLESEFNRSRDELQRLQGELEKLQGDYEKQQSALSATARQQREQEFQQKLTAARQRGSELEQGFEKRRAELLQPIEQRIRDAIEAVRKDGGYAFIFERGTFVAADTTLDLTARVLTRLRGGAGPAGGAK